jgi:hypothetical protein
MRRRWQREEIAGMEAPTMKNGGARPHNKAKRETQQWRRGTGRHDKEIAMVKR